MSEIPLLIHNIQFTHFNPFGAGHLFPLFPNFNFTQKKKFRLNLRDYFEGSILSSHSFKCEEFRPNHFDGIPEKKKFEFQLQQVEQNKNIRKQKGFSVVRGLYESWKLLFERNGMKVEDNWTATISAD